MKFSEQLVRKAIAVVIPDSPKFPNSIGLPSLLKLAMEEIFLDSRGGYLKTMDDVYAEMVVKTALRELRTTGAMEFGTLEEFWM